MKISVLLPYKENFSSNNAGAVSLFVKHTIENSKFFKNSYVFGNMQKQKPFLKNYINIELKKMTYDGRVPDIPWREQNIKSIGYHYYMTPETAEVGLSKLSEAIKRKPKKWSISDWPDVSKMNVFSNIS